MLYKFNCPNRRVFNFLLFYGLNPLQLTQEKEKSSVDQGFTGCVNIFLLECDLSHNGLFLTNQSTVQENHALWTPHR